MLFRFGVAEPMVWKPGRCTLELVSPSRTGSNNCTREQEAEKDLGLTTLYGIYFNGSVKYLVPH